MSTIPEQLDQISVKLKANVYFDGGVTSHTLLKDGRKQTVGLIRPGNYHFKTDAPERMDIVAGDCRVMLAREESWRNYSAGQTFHVPGQSAFDIAVDKGLAEYLCTFE